MPKIPVYQAGNLASEQAGTPAQDQSGQIIAHSVAQAAGAVMDLAAQQLAKQKTIQQNLDVTIAQTDYQVAYLGEKQKITSDPDITSDQVEEALNKRSAELSSEITSRYSSGSTQQAVQSAIQQDQQLFRIDAVKSRITLGNKEAFNTWFSSIDRTIQGVNESGSPEAYQIAVTNFKKMTPSIVPLTGDNLESAQKATQNAIDSMTTQFVASGIEKGQEDSLEQMRILGQFGEASDSTQKRISDTLNTALKTKSFRADITTAYKTLNQNVDDVTAIRNQDKSFADIEHDLSATTYELSTAKLSDSQKDDLKRRITTLDALRTAQLTGAYVKGSDNLDTLVSLRSDAAMLLQQSEGQKQLAEGVHLNELKKYQDRLVSEFVDNQNISGKTFTALYTDSYGVMLKDLTNKTFEQTGWEKLIHATPAATKDVLPKEDRAPLFKIYDAAKKPDGTVDPDTMYRAYDEYLNDKKTGKLVEGMFSPEQAQEYYMKASLRKQGFSSVYKIGDMITTKKGPRKITGFENGRVMIEDNEQDRQTVQFYKQYGTMKK